MVVKHAALASAVGPQGASRKRSRQSGPRGWMAGRGNASLDPVAPQRSKRPRSRQPRAPKVPTEDKAGPGEEDENDCACPWSGAAHPSKRERRSTG